MYLRSKNTSLIILAVTSVLCSRTIFFFIDDPEGPNLFVVLWMAFVLFALSLTTYIFNIFPKLGGLKKLLFAVSMQIVLAVIFCLLLQ